MCIWVGGWVIPSKKIKSEYFSFFTYPLCVSLPPWHFAPHNLQPSLPPPCLLPHCKIWCHKRKVGILDKKIQISFILKLHLHLVYVPPPFCIYIPIFMSFLYGLKRKKRLLHKYIKENKCFQPKWEIMQANRERG